MISQKEFEELKIGDELSVRGRNAKIICTENHLDKDLFIVAFTDKNNTFGPLTSLFSGSQKETRLSALKKFNLPEETRTWRLFRDDVDRILLKENENISLQEKDLANLKDDDYVTINGIDSKIFNLRINGYLGPFVIERNDLNCNACKVCSGACCKNLPHIIEMKKSFQKLSDIIKKNKVFLKPRINSKLEDEKEVEMASSNNSPIDMIKNDAQEAAYRTAAKKGVRALRAAILKIAKSKGADRKEVNYLKKAFESDFGEAVLSMALGYMLTYAPLPDTVKTNKHFSKIVFELRVGGIQVGMDAILEEAMNYVGPVLDEIKNLLPEAAEDIEAAIPARIAKPTTKRIKTSQKEDQEDQEEIDEEVDEKSKKKMG